MTAPSSGEREALATVRAMRRSEPTMDAQWSAGYNAALSEVERQLTAAPPGAGEGEVLTEAEWEGLLWSLTNRATYLASRFGAPVHLVGSALNWREQAPRDIDIRIVLPDAEWEARFGGNSLHFNAECSPVYVAEIGKMTRLLVRDLHRNIDFQVQPENWLTRHSAHDKPRLLLADCPVTALSSSPPSGAEPTTCDACGLPRHAIFGGCRCHNGPADALWAAFRASDLGHRISVHEFRAYVDLALPGLRAACAPSGSAGAPGVAEETADRRAAAWWRLIAPHLNVANFETGVGIHIDSGTSSVVKVAPALPFPPLTVDKPGAFAWSTDRAERLDRAMELLAQSAAFPPSGGPGVTG